VRAGLEDLYYNSVRFLAANLVLGVLLIVIAVLATTSLLALAGLLLAVPVAAGIMRMATSLVRDGHCSFADFTAELGPRWRTLGTGAVQLLVLLVLVVDVAVGASLSGVPGAFLTASALYGIGIWWLASLALWPLLLDPMRRDRPVMRTLRLAGLLLVARPLGMVALGAVLGAVLVLSTIAVAPLVTISIAVTWVIAARYVLPAADRLEGRPQVDIGEE